MPAGMYPRVCGDELKRRLELVRTMQARSLPEKVRDAQLIIDKLATDGNLGVMFSGGRDSCVVAKLAAKHNPVLIYCDTGLSSANAARRVKSAADNLGLRLEVLTPEVPAFRMWQELGHYPIGPKRGHTYWKRAVCTLRTSPVQCCYHLKEKPAKAFIKTAGLHAILWGNRASDSNRRKLSVADFGMLQPPSGRWPCWSAEPIACWTDADIAEYLRGVGLYFEPKSEDGCLVCCTDISRVDNQLTKTFCRNRKLFDEAIQSGLGLEILHAQGWADATEANVINILANTPQRFLRVKPPRS